ncbi:MAG: transposase [Gemmatimonadetes bacterium]|nr:transposase [Gemmatimonadota bacterium]MBA4158175.1 transposase [Gemmatimonadota bacterium]
MAKGRQYTADEKLKVLEEARQPGTTVAEVLRRYGLEATTFYRWERQVKEAVREAFSAGAAARRGCEGPQDRAAEAGACTQEPGDLRRWWRRTWR